VSAVIRATLRHVCGLVGLDVVERELCERYRQQSDDDRATIGRLTEANEELRGITREYQARLERSYDY
jgi:hypothetical protein